MTDIKIDRVFIGSCTNARLEDLIEASKVIKGQKVSSDVKAMVVPGSQMVKKQAEEMGSIKFSLMLILNGEKLDVVCVLE